MLKTRILFFFGVLSAGNVYATEVTLKYDDLRLHIETRNLHVNAGKQSVSAAEKGTGYLGRSYLPTLSAEGGIEHFQTAGSLKETQPYGAITANLNLFRGGKDSAEERIREARLQRAKAGAESILFDELTKARKEYWMLVYSRELTAVLKEALNQNDQNLESARKRFSAGMGSETDRYDFEMARVQIQQDLAKTEVAVLTAQRNLSVLLGHPQDTKIFAEEKIVHVHDDALFSIQLNSSENREIRSLNAEKAALDAKKTQHQRWWFPSFDLYGGQALYTFRERDHFLPSDRVDTFFGAKLSLTLFDGLQNQSEAAMASAEASYYENQALQSSRELEARVEGAKIDLKVSHDLIHEIDAAAELGQRYLKGTLSEYRRGLKNSPDVAGALSRAVDLRRRSAEVRRDYQLARTELLNLIGN